MKPSLSLSFMLVSAALIGGAQAAVYFNNFNGFGAAGSDVHGQFGWYVSDTTDQYSQVVTGNFNYTSPTANSKGLNLGDASAVVTPPTVAKVTMGHSFNEPAAHASASFNFVLVDSISDVSAGDFRSRDSFGFSFSNGSTNLLSVILAPSSQSTDPDNDEGNWDLFYSVGNGPRVSLAIIDIAELSQYGLSFGLTPNSNPLLSNFYLTLSNGAGSLSRNVNGLAIDQATNVSDFGIFWEREGATHGSSSIVVDTLNVIPEPSSMLLVGLAGLGFVSRRKRA